MAKQELYNRTKEERKADVKRAIDDSFCGVLVCHNDNTDQWELLGYSEVGYESLILEALDVAVCRAREAVAELVY